jgi:protein involved in polysaccharide export with SLBB domain
LSLALLSPWWGGGCGSTKQDVPVEAAVVEPPSPIVERLSLGPGDEIEIKFFYTPDLNDVQRIRPDGKISMQLVGEVMAFGRTPAGLESTLEELYKPFVEKPEVTVIVRDLTSRAIYVGGEVINPGRIAMPGRLSLLGALLEAGGVNATLADRDTVYLIRHDALGNRTVKEVDLEADMEGRSVTYLEPQDIVFVPRSTIVNVDQWVDQYINKVVPQFGFTYSHTSSDGRDTVGVDTSASR